MHRSVALRRLQRLLQQNHPYHKPGAEDLPGVVGTSAYRLQLKEQARLDLGHALRPVGPVASGTPSAGL